MLRYFSKVLQNPVTYSRAFLEDLAIDKEALRKQAENKALELKKENIYNLPANQKNVQNHIKIKLNHPVWGVNPTKEYERKQCAILEPDPIVLIPDRLISAKRKYIITSIKKAKEAMYGIKKLHILDAIAHLEASRKKVGKLMVRTCYNLIDHATIRGYDPSRLFIYGCLIGKTKRYKNTRYHAKGKGAAEKRDFCQVKIVCYEKKLKQFFEDVGSGHCAPGYANFIRRILLTKHSSFKAVSEFTHVTTAKGRQQAREIIKRKADKIMRENEQKNEYVPKKTVLKELKEEAGIKVKILIQKLFNDDSVSSLKLRERLFKKNMGLDA